MQAFAFVQVEESTRYVMLYSPSLDRTVLAALPPREAQLQKLMKLEMKRKVIIAALPEKMLEIAWQAYLWTWRNYSSFKPYAYLSDTIQKFCPNLQVLLLLRDFPWKSF